MKREREREEEKEEEIKLKSLEASWKECKLKQSLIMRESWGSMCCH